MMNFILPLLKLSNRVRDALIDVLRKAMTKWVFPYPCKLFEFISFASIETIAHGAWPSLVIA